MAARYGGCATNPPDERSGWERSTRLRQSYGCESCSTLGALHPATNKSSDPELPARTDICLAKPDDGAHPERRHGIQDAPAEYPQSPLHRHAHKLADGPSARRAAIRRLADGA